MLSSFVWGIHNVEVARKATDVNKYSLQHKTGGVLELSTFNYFFAGAFFCWCCFLFRHKQSSEQRGNPGKQSAHASKKAAINLPLIQPPSLRMETTGLRKSTRQFPMQIIKIGNGAEAAAMLWLLFLRKKSIH